MKKQKKCLPTASSKPAFCPHVCPAFSSSLVRMHFLFPLTSLQLSDDESDLEISSLEDLPQDLGQREEPKPLSRSKPPEKFGSSPWSPGRPRVPGW